MVRASDCPSSRRREGRLKQSLEPRLQSLTLFFQREEKIGETFDFARGKIHTEANNLGRIVVVSPNAETVSGRFSGNPSASVMTAPLRSPAVPAEAKTIRHCVKYLLDNARIHRTTEINALSHSQLTLVNSRLPTLTLASDLLGTGLKRMHLLRGLAG
jgi:hypothetical protein